MATLRVHHSTEYWKKTDLMVKPASYPIAVGYDVPSVDTIHRPLTLDLSEVCHEDRVYWAVRRAQDILLSSLALVVLSPLLLVTYAAIWIDSPGASPIFTQQRVGRNGKLFKMYKFRTMCPELVHLEQLAVQDVQVPHHVPGRRAKAQGPDGAQ